MDLEANLNEKQQEAVKSIEGPVLVLAGPGSGKTRSLTYRTAYLIEKKGVAPENILTLTFTNKASQDMKKKIYELVGKEKCRGMWIGTFHSMGLKILSRHLSKVNRQKGYTIYGREESLNVIEDLIKENNLGKRRYNPQEVFNVIKQAKLELIPSDELTEIFFEKGGRSKNYYENVSSIYQSYEEILNSNNVFDYNDLIVKTIQLFEQYPWVLGRYRNQFKYIQIDEYQDTNLSQYKIASLLCQPERNIFAVGDDFQSIYRFRGADLTNILEFEKDFPEAKVIKLEQNYRSTQNILEASNKVIQNNTQNKEKEIWSQKEQGEKVEVYKTTNPSVEAKYIVNKIKELTENEYTYQDISLLYRSNYQSRIIEKHLVEENIPYQVLKGYSFYDRKEIKDFLSYLQVLVNPHDHLALNTVLKLEAYDVGAVVISQLQDYAIEQGRTLMEVMDYPQQAYGVGPKRGAEIRDFKVNVLDRIQDLQAEDTNAEEKIKRLYKLVNYDRHLKTMTNYEERKENIDEFFTVVSNFQKENPAGTVQEFLREIKLVQDQDDLEDEKNKVNLMTAHSAKGLEFPVVFVVGVEEGSFPHYYSIQEKENGEDEFAIEEERRLFYVAMTRAEERLLISYNQTRKRRGQVKYQMPSRFLYELPEKNTLIYEVSKRNELEINQLKMIS